MKYKYEVRFKLRNGKYITSDKYELVDVIQLLSSIGLTEFKIYSVPEEK